MQAVEREYLQNCPYSPQFTVLDVIGSNRREMQFSNFHIFSLFPNCDFAGYIEARNKRFANKLMSILACRIDLKYLQYNKQ